MARTAREIFETHNLREDEPLLRSVSGSYLFDIDQVGSWFVECDKGKVKVDRSEHKTADCMIHCSEQDFVDMIDGGQNMVTAWMQGRVEVEGDIGLAQKFNQLVGTLNQRRRGAA